MTWQLEADGTYGLLAAGINAKGQRCEENAQRLRPDGVAYPVDGLPGLASVTTRPNGNTIRAEAKREDGSLAGEGTCTGRPLASWTIRDVDPGRGYTIEGGSFLERAVLLVHWRFDPLTDRTARLTQRIELLGENAAAHVDAIQSLFEPNMEPGLRRIAQRMAASR